MKKIFKRIAAITTGAAMLGATLTSALALDLAEYPSPFSVSGKHDTSTRIVVGDNAKAIDTVGAASIEGQFVADSYTTTSSSGSKVVVSGGKSDQVPISSGSDCGIATCVSISYLDQELEDDDIDILQDSAITFASKDYDFHDALVLGQYSPSIETSLTIGDDDFETDVVMKLNKDSLKYYYLFDESINVSTATATNALEIKFLGQRLKITSATATSITAQVGQEFFMDVDDSVTSEGRTVTLVNVGTTAVVVDVDGAKETITDGGTETVQGIEIHVDEIFYEDNKAQRSAVLVVGKDATDTYSDNEDYRTDIEDWDWDIGGLTSSASSVLSLTGSPSVSSGPFIGIENDFTANSDDDEYIVSTNAAHNKCYTLPGDYLEVCLDSLSVADDDYIRVKIELDTSLDETKAWVGDSNRGASEKAILIRTPNEAEGLELESTSLANLTSDTKTSKIWIHHDGGDSALNNVSIYYHDSSDSSNSPKWAGSINVTSSANFGRVNYQDTKGTNVEFDILGVQDVTDSINITLDILGDETSSPVDGDDDMTVQLSHTSAAFDGIGSTPDSEEADELLWNTTTIGTKDEDHRSIYGIIIRDPKGNGANDEVVFDVPGDQVLANVVAKGTATTTGGSGGSKVNVPITSPLTILSSEVGSAANHNLILVGGPCVNPTISQVSGLSAYNSCEGWSLSPGEAVIKLVDNGNKAAMLVAGTTGDDTRRATTVVSKYGDYALSGTEVSVKGTSLTDITVA